MLTATHPVGAVSVKHADIPATDVESTRTCSRVVPQVRSTNPPSPAMGLTLSWACAGVARQISAAHGADNAAAVMRVRAG